MDDNTRNTSWGERAALVTLFGFTAMSVLGYGIYGLHPERIPATDFALKLFSTSFELFARVHIVLAALVLAVVLFRRLGVRWLLPLALVSLLAFFAEHIGTGYGIPFGGYEYTGLLGLKVGGRVPLLIPISWFLMALPSWIIARSALDTRSSAARRIALASVWLVVWDLALDPAMSFLVPYWRWEEAGSYYGMPLINLAGWYATGVALMAVIEAFASRSHWDALDVRWMAAYYGAMIALPLGMLAVAGAWLAVMVTLGAVAVTLGLTAWLRGRNRASHFVSEPTRTLAGA